MLTLIRFQGGAVHGRVWTLRSESDRLAIRAQFGELITNLGEREDIDKHTPFCFSDFSPNGTPCCVLLWVEPIREGFYKEMERIVTSVGGEESINISLIDSVIRLALFDWYRIYGPTLAAQVSTEATIEIFP